MTVFHSSDSSFQRKLESRFSCCLADRRPRPKLAFYRHRAHLRACFGRKDGLRRFAAPSSFSPCPGISARHFGPPAKKEDDMPIGKVKFFNTQKGFGFIQPEDGGNDAFVHISAVERAGMNSLVQDQRVSYELETDQRGKTSAVKLENA
jgi:CspA family cold shock protein